MSELGRPVLPPVVLEPDQPWEGGFVAGPSVVRRAGEVLLFYASEGGIGVARSNDGGRSFDRPTEVDLGDPLGRVDVVVLDDGTPLVSWVELRDGAARILVRRAPGNDVPGAPPEWLGQLFEFWQIVRRYVAQPWHAQDFGGGLTLLPARPVLAAGMRMSEAGIDDGHLYGGGNRNFLELARRRIEEERRLSIAETADHLIHDADRSADEICFGFVSDHREIDSAHAEPECGVERSRHGDFERRAR